MTYMIDMPAYKFIWMIFGSAAKVGMYKNNQYNLKNIENKPLLYTLITDYGSYI